ncbi:MAG: DUF3078 domain-containing protein [Saprospiraceae bacterium]
MFKKITLFFSLIFVVGAMQAQTESELKEEFAAKEAAMKEAKKEYDALKGEVDAIAAKIDGLQPWKFGALGTLGLNFSQFNNWFGAANPDAYSSTIGFSGNAFANLNKDKYFWRNAGNLNMAWTKLAINEEVRDTAEYENTADAVNVTSLFGYKLTEKFAISALGEFRSTIVNNFANPGFLDLGVGATWTPISDLVVVFHPLNYNIVIADEGLNYESSLGCKIVADYAKSLPKGINWRSNLSAFISYSDVPNLSNWTWVNGLSVNVWKGLGVGFELGLRSNKQESYNKFVEAEMLDPETFNIDDLDSGDNPLQTYWVLGFTYTL